MGVPHLYYAHCPHLVQFGDPKMAYLDPKMAYFDPNMAYFDPKMPF